MSAFLVSNQTMQKAVEAVLIAEANAWSGDTVEAKENQVSMLGTQLYKLNQDALAARYGDDDPAELFIGRGFRARMASQGDANIQRLKSLNCLIYQCSEGDVPETELFKRLEKAAGGLAQIIVTSLPAYDTAKWDG